MWEPRLGGGVAMTTEGRGFSLKASLRPPPPTPLPEARDKCPPRSQHTCAHPLRGLAGGRGASSERRPPRPPPPPPVAWPGPPPHRGASVGPVSPMRRHPDLGVSDCVTRPHDTNFAVSAGDPVLNGEAWCLTLSSAAQALISVSRPGSTSPSGTISCSWSLCLCCVSPLCLSLVL